MMLSSSGFRVTKRHLASLARKTMASTDGTVSVFSHQRNLRESSTDSFY